jgi:hypothetical protein
MGLDIVEMVMAVETEFRVDIPDADAERLSTVGALFDYIALQLTADPPAAGGGPYAGRLWERYLDVLVREIGIARSALRPEARFVQDLGMD